MRKQLFGVLAMVMSLGMLCICGSAKAADVTAAVDINSAYVWRGMTFNDGEVLQPSLGVTQGGFGVNVWGNMDLDDYNDTLDSGEFSEVDLTLSYSWTMGAVDAGIGYIEYMFPTTDAGGAPGTREIYVTLGTSLPAGFSTSLGVYYDIDEVEDVYAVLSLGYSLALSEKLGLNAGASIGYAGDEYCADSKAGFYDYSLSLSLSYAVTEAFSVTGKVAYADSLDDDNLVDVDKGGPLDVKTWCGINLSYAF